jgi:hypothetical protein
VAGIFAFAQANSELTGIVTDQSGAVVAGAKIVLTDPGTGATRATESSATGLYDISALNPATYSLKVSAKGFETFQQTGVVVNVSSTLRVDVKLTVGAETQTVTVEADALAVQTDSNVVSTLISSEQISEIATENRNFAALAALGLGVSSALPDSNTPTSVASNFTISINGLRQSHNIWLIDGGEADDRGGAGGMDIMPSQDAIAEFNVMSSNYPPDYGISSGATISLSLKSGTQKFHGSLFEFNRNSAFNAKEPLTQSLTHVRYNIFGGNIGGPVFIPKVYNTDKQKTFFFWNEEWRKLRNGGSAIVQPSLDPLDIPKAGQDLTYVAPKFAADTKLIVPKASDVGDPAFQAKLAALGLTQGDPFPNNKIPYQLFDNNAVVYMNSGIIGAPDPSDDKYRSNISIPIDVRDDVVRADHKFNDKWAILGHYMHDSVSQGYAVPFLGWLWASFNTVTSNLSNPANSAAIKLTGQINPNLVVEGSINYDGNVIDITNGDNSLLTSSNLSGWDTNAKFFDNGSKSVISVDGGWGGPYYAAEGMGSAPWHNAAQDYEPKVDVSYMSGKHQLKFGFSYNRYTKNQQLFGSVMGTTGFGSRSNDSMMDMLMGLANNYGQFAAAPIRHYVNQTPSVYAMDNWHVTPRLSLQLGLRYDALPHAWERQDFVSNFNPDLYINSLRPTWKSDGSLDPNGPGFQMVNGTPFYLNGVGLAGQNGFPHGLVVNDYNTLQPRVGFSDDLFGNGRTVLRGGLGTFYERMQGNDIYNAATTPPFAYSPSAGNVYLSEPNTNYVTGESAALPFFPSGITNIAHVYKAPAVAQYSLGVQHELSPSIIWVVQYVGNLAWHQNITRNINNFPVDADLNLRCNAGDGGGKYPGDVCPNGNAPTSLGPGISDQNRSYQGWGGINQQENTTNGNYNGFQSGIRVQNRWGLSGEIDYTWSHEIDLTGQDLQGVSNPWNLKYDKASGFLDRRHILSANYVYKLPFLNKKAGMVHSLLGGWELAGTVIAQTGVIPQNTGPGLSMNYDSIGLGGGYTNRPDVNGKVKYTKQYAPWNGKNQWFDTSQFSVPVPAWLGGPNLGFGNSRRDAIVGPGRLNFTTSVYKSFAITERAHIEFRCETFNTFNHFEPNSVNVAGPDPNIPINKANGWGNSQFGQITTAYDPRNLQFGGKFVF